MSLSIMDQEYFWEEIKKVGKGTWCRAWQKCLPGGINQMYLRNHIFKQRSAMTKFIVEPCCSWIPHDLYILYLQICLLTRSICDTQLNIMVLFVVICIHAQSREKFSLQMYRSPAKVQQSGALPTCFRSHNINKCPFMVYFLPRFTQCCAFCCWFCNLKQPLSKGAEMLSS